MIIDGSFWVGFWGGLIMIYVFRFLFWLLVYVRKEHVNKLRYYNNYFDYVRAEEPWRNIGHVGAVYNNFPSPPPSPV